MHDELNSVVFLDVDGVLNTPDSVVAQIGPTKETSELVHQFSEEVGGLPYGVTIGLQCVDPTCVGLLNRLLDETGAGLVLSSTHRLHFAGPDVPYGSSKHLALLKRYLTIMGVNVPENWFSITSRSNGSIRGAEIHNWLQLFYENYDEDVKYAILDDSRDFYGYQNLVKVNGEHGFNYHSYLEAIKFLGTKVPSIL